MLKIVSFLLLTIALITTPSPSTAQSQSIPTDSTAHEIFLEIMSPFCPGRSLQDCPSGKASELKDEIRDKLAGGQTKDQIMSEMIGRFGEGVRALPPTQGVGILAWALPVVFFAFGAVLFSAWIARTKIKKSSH